MHTPAGARSRGSRDETQRGGAATKEKKPPLTLPLAKGEKEGVHSEPENLVKNLYLARFFFLSVQIRVIKTAKIEWT